MAGLSPDGPAAAAAALLELLEVMRRLRDPDGGCPWDLAQDFATIAPHTLEEAYEVADAIERGQPDGIRDELGDLLFQVVFHARLGEELGWFDFATVAASITAKLRRRHPHVFAAAGGIDVATHGASQGASQGASHGASEGAPQDAAQGASWERIKADERRAAGDAGVLAGVASALPALARAAKLGKRAGRVGFDWPDAGGVRDKVVEELGELDEVIETGAVLDRRSEELGDLLFAVASWGRHLGVEPEAALRAANRKFERRFAAIEAAVRARGQALESLTPAQWDALWVAAKQAG